MARDKTTKRPTSVRPAAASGGAMPRRPYGRDGTMISVIGMGGIVIASAEQEHANRVVAQAVERGVNYFDVAPTYGQAELRLGPALEPYRKDCFLACKTTERTAEGARRELNQSLLNLRTDHLDLYQLHAITDVAKDVDAAFAAGGAMEVFLEARRSGQVRHLGFSAHSEAAALAAMDRFDFDSVLLPVNFACWMQGDFPPRVLDMARRKGLTILALKALARQNWPADAPPGSPRRKQYPGCWYEPITDPHEAGLALRFTLGQGVTAALPPGAEEVFWLAVSLAADLRPLSAEEEGELRALAGGLSPVFTV